MLISSKNTLTEASRIMFDHISGNHGPDELKHKINHYTEHDLAPAYLPTSFWTTHLLQTYRSFHSSQTYISSPHFRAFIYAVFSTWKACPPLHGLEKSFLSFSLSLNGISLVEMFPTSSVSQAPLLESSHQAL